MTKYLRAYRADDQPSEDGPIRFVASTDEIARDGMIIEADAWQLTNFRANPVVLFAHDYWSRPPIGRAEVSVEQSRLIADITFDRDDPFAADLERKARSGFIHAVSVGWDTLEFAPSRGPDQPARITKADLLDVSLVPVPSDPKALKERQARGFAELAELMTKLTADPTDDTPEPDQRSASDETDWHGTAALMARLYRTDVGETDAERKRLHGRLSARYRKLGQEAPEFFPLADLDQLSGDEIRGLFLAGEDELFPELLETATGPGLSARTRGELAEVARLIAGILGRTTEAAEAPPAAPPTTTTAEEPDDLERSMRALYAAMAA